MKNKWRKFTGSIVTSNINSKKKKTKKWREKDKLACGFQIDPQMYYNFLFFIDLTYGMVSVSIFMRESVSYNFCNKGFVFFVFFILLEIMEKWYEKNKFENWDDTNHI